MLWTAMLPFDASQPDLTVLAFGVDTVGNTLILFRGCSQFGADAVGGLRLSSSGLLGTSFLALAGVAHGSHLPLATAPGAHCTFSDRLR